MSRRAKRRHPSAVEEIPRSGPLYFNEVGVSGLKYSSGYVDEEFLPPCAAARPSRSTGRWRTTTPSGCLLFAIEQLCASVDWKSAGSEEPAEGQGRRVGRASKDDMSHTWDDLSSEVALHLSLGWAWHEIMYKRGSGPGRRMPPASKYTDGLLGWRKMPLRSQDTLHRWLFDETGKCKGWCRWRRLTTRP